MKSLNKKVISSSFVLFAIILFVSGVFLISIQTSQEYPLDMEEWESGGTSIQVGRDATANCSVITAHSCDGNYRTWVNIEPH